MIAANQKTKKIVNLLRKTFCQTKFNQNKCFIQSSTYLEEGLIEESSAAKLNTSCQSKRERLSATQGKDYLYQQGNSQRPICVMNEKRNGGVICSCRVGSTVVPTCVMNVNRGMVLLFVHVGWQ